jgi:hypothetical protein
MAQVVEYLLANGRPQVQILILTNPTKDEDKKYMIISISAFKNLVKCNILS